MHIVDETLVICAWESCLYFFQQFCYNWLTHYVKVSFPHSTILALYLAPLKINIGSQGIFYEGHKITIAIWPVGFSKNICLKIYKVINQVSSQTKQVNELHVPIKHIYKSLVKVNKKTFFYFNFYSIAAQTKKTKTSWSKQERNTG